jgi:hypothetical protein
MNAPTPGFGAKHAITTRHGGPKPFAWSYSRLKNYESCPKRSWHIDVLPKGDPNKVIEPEGEQLLWGNAVHKAFAKRLVTPFVVFPKGMERYESWAEKILVGSDNLNVKILVEQQLAISADFGPVPWFDSAAWFRGIGDVIKIIGPVALIVDWKTGKILEDSQQLALMAACVFAHHPEVQKVRSEFAWLKEDATTRADFHRNEMADMWKHIWPRIEALKNAYETTSYPAKPGALCKRWCPVTQCPHNGE